jgi:hypothetical protein
MAVQFESWPPPVTDHEISAFEANLPAGLPSDYRAFLLQQDGGEPEPNWWPPETGVDAGVREFYGLSEDLPSFSRLQAAREVFSDRVPDHLLPIGYDGTGGQMCVALTGEDTGSIWYYDPEFEFDDDDPDPDLLVRVCGSFGELLSTLEPKPSYEEMRRRVLAAAGSGQAQG